MTLTTDAPTTRRHVRTAVFLPAVGLIAAAATQIDAAITTNAFRSVSPAPEDSLNFPWYGELAGQISTWWSFHRSVPGHRLRRLRAEHCPAAQPIRSSRGMGSRCRSRAPRHRQLPVRGQRRRDDG